ncbi:hypothetical protein LXA43DRAFT_1099161 [Ganoderma leucocontextum]|nr:hypothetical protein LXA43DRAFT_1099161 [Ganoderma leucocontextum]
MESQQSVDKEAILHAAEERIKELRKKTPSQILCRPHDEEHDKRQAFRRRVDYIIGANKPAQAIQLCTQGLCLLNGNQGEFPVNPEEDKYRRFKITNDRVQKTIMVPEGVCDLLVDLGFREKHATQFLNAIFVDWQAVEYSSYYIYSAKSHNSLRVGSAIIEEILEREVKKHEEEMQRRQREEEEQKELIEKLHKQFLDDRKSVEARVQRERESGVQEKGIPRPKGAPRKANIVTIHG